jgi:hypothetical protein
VSWEKGQASEEGSLFCRQASRGEESGAPAELERGRYLPRAQPPLTVRSNYPQPPLPRLQPQARGLHRQGAGLPPPHLAGQLQPQQPSTAIYAAHRQAQHFPQMGRLASMQSAQVMLLTTLP